MFELPAPDEKTREKIFGIHTRNKPIDKKINLNKLAKETEGLVGADIEFICRQASVIAIREIIDELNGKEAKPDTKIVITGKHFNEVIQVVKTQKLLKK